MEQTLTKKSGWSRRKYVGWKHKPHRNERYGEYVKKFRETSRRLENKRLKQLKRHLLKIKPFPKSVTEIISCNIKFFDIISRFQDQGYLKYQLPERHSTCKSFNEAIKECGRQKDYTKWNVSQKGETVNNQNVWYGGVWELPVKPAIYWLNLPKNCKVKLSFSPILIPKDKPESTITKEKTLWATEALVKCGIEHFTVKNTNLFINLIDELLA